MIKLNVSAANIAVEEKETLTEGRVGLLCQFHFSPDWDGLVKTAVFDGADSRDVILKSDTVAVPAECLAAEGYSLSVGVYGKNAAGDIVIPTVYATVGKIQRSAYPSGKETAEPTPDVVAQIQQAAANAEELARSVREDADLGKFNGGKGDKGDKGDKGNKGDTGDPGGWYAPEVTQPDANTIRMSFTPSKEGMPAVADTDITLPAGGNGLTTAQINALDGMFKVCAFIKDDVSAEYTAFKNAFGIADSGGETEVTLSSITASYSGGDVPVGTAVTALTGIVVTAHYSDGTSKAVTEYTLSGTIAEGSNTVTVTYQGKTATFTVTGVAESGVSNETTWTDGVAYTYTTVKDEYLETNGTFAQYNGWDRTPYLYCSGASKLRVVVKSATSSILTSSQYNGFFDENKNFISQFKYNTIDQNTVGAYVDVSVPADAVYFIASGKNTVITDNLSNGPAVSFTPYK